MIFSIVGLKLQPSPAWLYSWASAATACLPDMAPIDLGQVVMALQQYASVQLAKLDEVHKSALQLLQSMESHDGSYTKAAVQRLLQLKNSRVSSSRSGGSSSSSSSRRGGYHLPYQLHDRGRRVPPHTLGRLDKFPEVSSSSGSGQRLQEAAAGAWARLQQQQQLQGSKRQQEMGSSWGSEGTEAVAAEGEAPGAKRTRLGALFGREGNGGQEGGSESIGGIARPQLLQQQQQQDQEEEEQLGRFRIGEEITEQMVGPELPAAAAAMNGTHLDEEQQQQGEGSSSMPGVAAEEAESIKAELERRVGYKQGNRGTRGPSSGSSSSSRQRGVKHDKVAAPSSLLGIQTVGQGLLMDRGADLVGAVGS